MVFPKVLGPFYDKVEVMLRGLGLKAGKSGRHMKFPYTFTAKIAQFPMCYYMKHNNIWMYYPFGWVLGLYLISYIHATVNSPEYKRTWAENQRKAAEKEAAEHHH